MGAEVLQVHGAAFRTGDGLSKIQIDGLDFLVGVIDDKERVAYLPSADHMRSRIQNLPADEFTAAMQTYMRLGEELQKQGYQRRFILDQ